MLLELRAENYAVIDHAVASFGPGLNLLTGETGAGKSILIDALVLLLGGKASSEVIRHGAEKAIVSCVFETTAGAEEILEESGIDVDGAEILLRREIAAGGKGRVFINNQPATVSVLKQLAPELALIHAQSDTFESFDQAQQRGLLDRFAATELEAASAAYAKWRGIKEQMEELQAAEQDRLRLADLWSFQAKEIGQAQLSSAEEDGALEAEKLVLANAEKIYAAAMGALEFLYEGESSAETVLAAALKQVEELARFDERFREAVQQLAGAKAAVEDVSATLRDYAGKVTASPARLEEIEDRLAAMDRLKRKYGRSLAEVMAFGDDVQQKLSDLENRDAVLAGLREKLKAAAEAYRAEAKKVNKHRAAAAKQLEKLAEAQINDLAMKARLNVMVTPREGEELWSAQGWDHVEYRIATNPGEPMKPLDEIASGGEMSRVMLALKVTVEEGPGGAVSRKKKTVLPRTLVFDEIDIGIGGRAAEAVGKKLKALSRGQQVLCISHLPQIAAFADQHLLIEKSEKQGRTRTQVRVMDEEERTEEIARMLSGATVTPTSRAHAQQMLKASR
jgi:DNA repair protein RecN (Recombination protein N)